MKYFVIGNDNNGNLGMEVIDELEYDTTPQEAMTCAETSGLYPFIVTDEESAKWLIKALGSYL